MSDNSLTNWGRWGPDDERGTLNLIDEMAIHHAASLVRCGKVYSLAVTLDRSWPRGAGRPALWHLTTRNKRLPPQHSSAEDLILLNTHATTHIDALSHIQAEGAMYNGYDADSVISPTDGSERNGIHNVVAIVGRGVLLDLAGYRGVDHLPAGASIGPEELDAVANHQRVDIRPGDIALIRTGWMRLYGQPEFDQRSPGPNGEVGDWFRERGLVAIGADNVSLECPATEGVILPLHIDIVRNQGGYLLELLNLEDLAKDNVHEFLFIAAPLRLRNGLGSPVNPVAIC